MEPLWTDVVSCLAAGVGLVVASYSAFVGLTAYHEQRTSYDVNLALLIFQDINRYWDRIANSEGDPHYNYGQILVQFEIAAALFNDGILTNQAEKILKDHIIEVYTGLMATQSGRKLLDLCNSSDETLQELKLFARRHFPQSLRILTFGDQQKA